MHSRDPHSWIDPLDEFRESLKKDAFLFLETVVLALKLSHPALLALVRDGALHGPDPALKFLQPRGVLVPRCVPRRDVCVGGGHRHFLTRQNRIPLLNPLVDNRLFDPADAFLHISVGGACGLPVLWRCPGLDVTTKGLDSSLPFWRASRPHRPRQRPQIISEDPLVHVLGPLPLFCNSWERTGHLPLYKLGSSRFCHLERDPHQGIGHSDLELCPGSISLVPALKVRLLLALLLACDWIVDH